MYLKTKRWLHQHNINKLSCTNHTNRPWNKTFILWRTEKSTEPRENVEIAFSIFIQKWLKNKNANKLLENTADMILAKKIALS